MTVETHSVEALAQSSRLSSRAVIIKVQPVVLNPLVAITYQPDLSS